MASILSRPQCVNQRSSWWRISSITSFQFDNATTIQRLLYAEFALELLLLLTHVAPDVTCTPCSGKTPSEMKGLLHEDATMSEVTHHSDVIMRAMASQITAVCSSVCSGADQRIAQSSASLALVRGIPMWPVDSPQGTVTRKIFPFDDVIMCFLMLDDLTLFDIGMIYGVLDSKDSLIDIG